MKKYIVIGAVTGIGGWQLYVDSRYGYKMNQGLDTCLLYPGHEDGAVIKLEHSKNGKTLGLKELRYPPHCYTKSQVKKILEKICIFIDYKETDEIFIESTCMEHSMWGEVLAKRVNGVNFAYLLHSHIENTPIARQRFFEFKYKQHLLAGQSDITLPDLFKDYMEVPSNDIRRIPASWDDPLCDYREDCTAYIKKLDEYKQAGYRVIGYFGTLSKPHFILLCDEIKEYVKRHENNQFLFVSIGSSHGGLAEKKQCSISNETSNCVTMNIPEMYPVPKGIFNKLDVCLGSWGSATSSARACQRTIRLYDDINLIPQGIIGVNLRELPYYKQPCGKETFVELLDKILFGDNYKSVEYLKPDQHIPSIIGQKRIDSMMKPFEKRELDHSYFDVETFSCVGTCEKRIRFLHVCFGVAFTANIRRLVRACLTGLETNRPFFKN